MTSASIARQRYALVTETYTPQINGVAHTLYRLSEGLRARGHAVQLVRPAQADEQLGTTHSLDHLELRVRGFPLPGYPELQWGLPAGHAISRLWHSERPDAVYLATEGPLGWSALRAARRLGIPAVSGFHTNFQQYSEHYGLGLLHAPAVRYLRWFHNLTRTTLTASSTQQRELSRLGVNNLALLGRGVDCQRFHPGHRDADTRARWRAASADIVLLHVGRLAVEKNLSLLVRCWKQLRQTIDAPRLRLVIVGDGPCRRALQEQLPDAFFTGALTGGELATVYASADIFVFPSLTETFGNVVTEAMASGLAVCAFDTAAAHQHMSDRYSGCLAALADETQFKENLQWLIRDGEGRRGIRLHARHKACQLDWGAVVRRFEGFLMQAQTNRNDSPATPVTSTRGLP